MPKSIQGIPDNYPMVTVRYEGAGAKHNITGLETKIKYGRKRKGDIFQMHRADVRANPEMYTILAEPSASPSELPKTPTAVRVPEQNLRPSIIEVGPSHEGPVGTEVESSFVETEKSVKSKSKPKSKTTRKRSTTTKRKTSTRKRKSTKGKSAKS